MDEQVYLTCLCFNCSGQIEFPAEGVGETIVCPYCKLDTTLYKILTNKPPNTELNKEDEQPAQLALGVIEATPIETEKAPTSESISGLGASNRFNPYFVVAVILFVIGLLFLSESDEEQFEQKMLSSAYKQHSISSDIYQIDMQLYRLGSATKSSVNRSEANFKDAGERIDKQKQKLSEISAGRRIKMCLFFAGAFVFFIGGVIQTSKPNN